LCSHYTSRVNSKKGELPVDQVAITKAIKVLNEMIEQRWDGLQSTISLKVLVYCLEETGISPTLMLLNQVKNAYESSGWCVNKNEAISATYGLGNSIWTFYPKSK